MAASAAAVGLAPLPAGPVRGGTAPLTPLRSAIPLPAAYAVPLPLPPVLKPVRTDATTDYYALTARPVTLSLVPGHHTQTWAYEGSYPGPTIVSRSGRRTVVTHHNHLPHPMVVHLHGGHTPHDSDGYPMDQIAPASSAAPAGPSTMSSAGSTAMPPATESDTGSRTYTYPLDQRATTLWYHDHTMGFTGPNVYRGLSGFHLVRDDEEDALHLPAGDRELPLMLADRAFDGDGGFAYPALDPSQGKPGVEQSFMNGVTGDVILVNGAPWPVAEVDAARYRLRLLNASNARRYQLALDPQPSGGGAFVQVGTDGGLLASPLTHDTLDVAPGQRYDLVVDFSRYKPGTPVQLVNRLGSGSTAQVLRFDIGTAKVSDDSRVPATLSTVERLDPAKAAAHRTFVFARSRNGWTINGDSYQPGRSLASPRLGDTEIWRFVSDFHHPAHLHLNPFQVVSRDGGAPGPYDVGWKDTVDVTPGQGVEVAVRFSDYAGRYLLHCHNLEHEDMAMMADFDTQG